MNHDFALVSTGLLLCQPVGNALLLLSLMSMLSSWVISTTKALYLMTTEAVKCKGFAVLVTQNMDGIPLHHLIKYLLLLFWYPVNQQQTTEIFKNGHLLSPELSIYSALCIKQKNHLTYYTALPIYCVIIIVIIYIWRMSWQLPLHQCSSSLCISTDTSVILMHLW